MIISNLIMAIACTGFSNLGQGNYRINVDTQPVLVNEGLVSGNVGRLLQTYFDFEGVYAEFQDDVLKHVYCTNMIMTVNTYNINGTLESSQNYDINTNSTYIHKDLLLPNTYLEYEQDHTNSFLINLYVGGYWAGNFSYTYTSNFSPFSQQSRYNLDFVESTFESFYYEKVKGPRLITDSSNQSFVLGQAAANTLWQLEGGSYEGESSYTPGSSLYADVFHPIWEEGKTLGKGLGRTEGLADGKQYVLDHLDDFHLYSQEQYESAYNIGFNEGISYSNGVSAVFNGIGTIMLLPIDMFLNIFNFSVLGINIGDIVSALLTICIVSIVVKRLIGG